MPKPEFQSAAEGSLDLAYSEWRRLAQAEGDAIRAGNWTFVAECQRAIARVRSEIDGLTRTNSETTADTAAQSSPSRPPLRASILELIELQRRNLLSLEQRRQRLSEHVQNVTRAGKNLRDIQRSYRMPSPAAWSSYS